MKPEQPVFQFDDESYAWSDVLACAEFTGQLRPILASLRAGVVAEEKVRGGNATIAEESLQNSANELRYNLNLITVDETEQWLVTRQLTLSDLNDFLFRRACAEAMGASASTASDGQIEVMPLLWPELVFSGLASALTMTFLNRLAARKLPFSGTVPQPDEMAAAKLRFCRREEIDPGEFSQYVERSMVLKESVDFQLQLDIYHERRAGFRLSEKELALSLAAARAGLFQAHYEYVAYQAKEAAKEAFLCVSADGESVSEVAGRSHGRYVEAHSIMSEVVPIELRSRFATCGHGECLPPESVGDGTEFVVARLITKTEPSLEDPEVCSRLHQQHVRDLLNATINDRVRWLESPLTDIAYE